MAKTATVKSFNFSTGVTTQSINEAAFKAALESLAADAADKVFIVEKGGIVMVAKVTTA